jgi:L-alanine-DL-glutamate epimerase-like enolase superfamily enzyme
VSSGTTIERVEVEVLSLPLHTPFVTALRRATTVESVVVRVTDSDGRVGLGEAPQNWQVLGSSVAGSTACMEGPLRDAVLGRSSDPVETWPVIDRAVAGNGAPKAALDCALHDLAGPGVVGVALPTVVTLPVGEPHEIAEAARARVAEGFRTLKLKVGTDAATDVARVRAAREGAGPDVALRVDANTGWDCFEAVRVIRALEDAGVGVQLVEQPVGRRDLLGLAHVRRHVETPVMADESVFDLDDLVELVRHDAADLVNVKIAKAGGLTPALELARVARAHGLGVSVGCMLESAVGVSAAVALAAQVDCDVAPDLDGAWWLAPGAPYAERVAYADGQVLLGRMEA